MNEMNGSCDLSSEFQLFQHTHDHVRSGDLDAW